MKELDELFLLKHTDDIVVQNMLRYMDEVEFKAWLRIGADFEDSGKYSKESLVKVLEFIYAIGSCAKDTGDHLKNAAKYNDTELRGLLLIIMKKSIDGIPSDKLVDVVLDFLCRMDDNKGTMTIN